MGLTPTQKQAVTARGNVLVIAGAGTGKTHTLVERCLDCLLREKPPVSLEEILIVTFTEAAAAELRQRIRLRLEQQAAPSEPRWQEQLALFDTAHIGTLHSFCLQLARQHFYELEMDPQLSVMAEQEARLLADETLDNLLQKHYAAEDPLAESVQQLIHSQAKGWDKPIRNLVLRLHHYSQTLPDPQAWFAGQLAMFASDEPHGWMRWLAEGIQEWRQNWLPVLKREAPTSENAANALKLLTSITETPSAKDFSDWRAKTADVLLALSSTGNQSSPRKRSQSPKSLKSFVSEAEFLHSLAGIEKDVDPLLQDWNWVRGHMSVLLQFSRDFSREFHEAKRELGVVDFHDLEQSALRLLWDAKKREPTTIARQWRQKLRFIFVDEYQDINAAQDRIITALGGEGASSNRFLVGDVKQSIYRFRLANPHIFQHYAESWAEGERKVPAPISCGAPEGQAIPLLENFRSREGILDFINSVFELLLRRELGGVTYENARLAFGAPNERHQLSRAASLETCVELHLRTKGRGHFEAQSESNSAEEFLADLEEADKEARMLGLRLLELKRQQFPVWDETAFRPVQWSDMAILLRAPSRKSESYAKEFARLGIPLLLERRGFYDALEVSDLLNLLRLLDNPLQDLPTLAVLHSPLVGLKVDELAELRLAEPRARFWLAMTRWHGQQTAGRSKRRAQGEEKSGRQPLREKVGFFLERFGRWRKLGRQVSLSQCLETVLAETLYEEWLLTQPAGEQRRANVRRLVELARQFDKFQRHGLFRFLRFIEAQQLAETEPEVAAVSEEDSVRLMSIHQSKGLEFPVVAVADLGKVFNEADLRADIILDEEYGLCPQIKPPQTGKRYPSLPWWLARRRQRQELLGEELRLLYVAMTRARDRLLLAGTLSESKLKSLQEPLAMAEVDLAALADARSYSDWLALWLRSRPGGLSLESGNTEGALEGMRWFIHNDLGSPTNIVPEQTKDNSPLSARPEAWEELRRQLSWQYPFSNATRHPAKTSVSALRRRAREELDETLIIDPQEKRPNARHHSSFRSPTPSASSASEIGIAHHKFLELVSLKNVHSLEALRKEAQRLEQLKALTREQAALLDLEGLAAFWNSELGRQLLQQRDCVERELAFTARFSPQELASLTGIHSQLPLADDFLVVQGVADLVLLMPDQIWLVDFKTDALASSELSEKARIYEPQLRLYASALSRIYRRPVRACWLYFLVTRQAVSLPMEVEQGSPTLSESK